MHISTTEANCEAADVRKRIDDIERREESAHTRQTMNEQQQNNDRYQSHEIRGNSKRVIVPPPNPAQTERSQRQPKSLQKRSTASEDQVNAKRRKTSVEVQPPQDSASTAQTCGRLPDDLHYGIQGPTIEAAVTDESTQSESCRSGRVQEVSSAWSGTAAAECSLDVDMRTALLSLRENQCLTELCVDEALRLFNPDASCRFIAPASVICMETEHGTTSSSTSLRGLDSQQTILFPIHHCRHWMLGMVDRTQMTATIYDPLQSSRAVAAFNALQRACNHLSIYKGILQYKRVYPYVLQGRSADSGIYVLAFALQFLFAQRMAPPLGSCV